MTTFSWTHDKALALVRLSTVDDGNGWCEAVAARMVAEDCCHWHAAHGEYVARVDDGRIATYLCSCGGRNFAEQGDHELCKARAARGAALSRLDIVRPCDCAACQAIMEVEDG